LLYIEYIYSFIFLFMYKKLIFSLFVLGRILSFPNMVSREILAPIRRRRILVFDVETTGKLPRVGRDQPPPTLEGYPHILQLSFVIFDLAERTIVRSFDSFVNVAQDVEISEFITGFTGIDRAKCNGGKSIVEVLEAFYEAYVWCDCLVAHNIEFDITMIETELVRHRAAILQEAPYCLTLFSSVYEKMQGIERYCTMKQGTKLCAIEHPMTTVLSLPTVLHLPTGLSLPTVSPLPNVNPLLIMACNENTTVATSKVGRAKSFKWPTLIELHDKLFGEKPDISHDAKADTLACLRCYVKMRHGYDMGVLY